MTTAAGTTDVSNFVALNPESCIDFLDQQGISKLNISNNSPTKNVAFKIRTTQPLCFVVKPNSGIIEAGATASIEINYVPNERVLNAAESKFQVQVAYTELKGTETAQLPNFYQYVQKSMIHSMKLTVRMNKAQQSAPSADNKEQQDNFVSMVQPASSQASPMKFEKAQTFDNNKQAEYKSQGTIYQSAVGNAGEVQKQIDAYSAMIKKETDELNKIKAQISKKGQNMGQSQSATVGGGAPTTGALANKNWEDNNASSGKKFKFIHLVVVSIVFLLLGSYLAKVDLPVAPSQQAQQTSATSETEEKTQTQEQQSN